MDEPEWSEKVRAAIFAAKDAAALKVARQVFGDATAHVKESGTPRERQLASAYRRLLAAAQRRLDGKSHPAVSTPTRKPKGK